MQECPFHRTYFNYFTRLSNIQVHIFAAFVACPRDCSNHGSCDNVTGVCDCDEKWVGEDCSTCEYADSYCLLMNILRTDVTSNRCKLGLCCSVPFFLLMFAFMCHSTV